MPHIDAGRLPANDSRDRARRARRCATSTPTSATQSRPTIGDKARAAVGRRADDVSRLRQRARRRVGTRHRGARNRGAVSRSTIRARPDGRYNYMVLRFAPGTAAHGRATAAHAFSRRTAALTRPACSPTVDPRRSTATATRAACPLTIGIVLVLLLVATLTHVLVSTMRRRSGDLAILRALGYTPRNLVATLRWQSFVLTAAAIVHRRPARTVREPRRVGRVLFAARHHARHGRSDRGSRGRARPACSLLALVLVDVVGLARADGMSRRFRFAS